MEFFIRVYIHTFRCLVAEWVGGSPHSPPIWRMLSFGQFSVFLSVLSFSALCESVSRSGSCGPGVQSIGSGRLGCALRVGIELTEAVWKELLDSWESDDKMMITCPKFEQFGLMLSGVFGGGSSEVSTRSTNVVSLFLDWCVESSVVGESEMLAMAFSTLSFLTVASALDLRILRSGGDFAIVATVLLLGVESIKSAAELDVANTNGFACPGDRSLNIRVVDFLSISSMLTGLWLRWNA